MDVINSARKTLVVSALKILENLRYLIVMSKGRLQHDLMARLSLLKKELESADYLNPDTTQLLERFSQLLTEIYRELNLRTERRNE